jgi:hypothetical protein
MTARFAVKVGSSDWWHAPSVGYLKLAFCTPLHSSDVLEKNVSMYVVGESQVM